MITLEEEKFLVDCTYIGVNKSPRSEVLPNFYGIDFVDFNLDVNIWTTLLNLLAVVKKSRSLTIKTQAVFIEYDGNIFLNFILLCASYNRDIYIDCHNCAVEREENKALRYYTNLVYLSFCRFFIKASLIVHNDAVKNAYPLTVTTVYTPYPQLEEYKAIEKRNDVVFSCSLNSDEPVELIIRLCGELAKKGFEAKISGDFTKLPPAIQEQGLPFFTGYMTKAAYLTLVAQSKVMVCLTSRDGTLLYSPREGISLGLSVIMNDSQVNRDFYGQKATYVRNEADFDEVILNALE